MDYPSELCALFCQKQKIDLLSTALYTAEILLYGVYCKFSKIQQKVFTFFGKYAVFQ